MRQAFDRQGQCSAASRIATFTVVMGLIPFKCSGMTGDDLAIGNNRNGRWVDVNADDTMGMRRGYAVAIALQMNQTG